MEEERKGTKPHPLSVSGAALTWPPPVPILSTCGPFNAGEVTCSPSSLSEREAKALCHDGVRPVEGERRRGSDAMQGAAAVDEGGDGRAKRLCRCPLRLRRLSQGHRCRPQRVRVAAHDSVHSSSSSSSGGGTSATGAPVIAAPVQPPTETLLPPPPPLPEFSSSPLHRSISMPDLPNKFPSKIHQAAPILEDDNEAEEENDSGLNRHRRRPSAVAGGSPSLSPSPAPPPPQPEAWDFFGLTDENMPVSSLTQAGGIRPEREEGPEEKIETSAPPPPVAKHDEMVGGDDEPVTPKKVVVETPLAPKVPRNQKQGGTAHHHHTSSAPTLDAQRGKTVPAAPPCIDLMKVLTRLDDLFLGASESTHEVSKVLEATRMHYHSNFVDSRGHIDHSVRVMRVITWHRSFEVTPGADGRKDDFIDDEWETHATVLDKILAWEKRLYDEVKAGKLMKIEYHRKVALLNREKKRGASGGESLQRRKAAVSHLHTKYVVDMQSMNSTMSEIQRLRDKRRYPKLVQLVGGMAKMWQAMHTHHFSQLKMMEEIRALDISNASEETSERHHHKRTLQLLDIVKEWRWQLHELVAHQREYVGALDSWLKLNLIPIESNLKERRVSSPQRPADDAPIQTLVHAWHEHLENLPEELPNTALLSFSAVLNTIEAVQREELKQKERCGEIHKEYLGKKRAFEDWCQKHSSQKKRMGERETGGEAASQNDPVGERRRAVESLKSKHDEEVEAHKGLCKQVREKSLVALKTHLPEVFRAVSDFAEFCSKTYTSLQLVTDQEDPPTK